MCEDHAELHAAAAHVPALLVAPFAPPPEALAEPPRSELEDFDRVAGELDLHRFEPDLSRRVDERFRFIAAQVAETVVMSPVQGRPLRAFA